MEKTAHHRKLRALPVLVLVNTLVFLLQISLPPLEQQHFLYFYGLSDGGLMRGDWWQLITYGFLHGNIWHLLFNMVGFWFAGRIVERVMGTGRFLGLYFACLVAGGLVPVLLGGIPTLLVGASGAVFGIIIAFTTMFPDAQIIALLFYVLPVPLRAKYLGWGVAAISVFLLLTGLLPQISHAAHLGGCVMGYVYTRLAGYGPPGVIERFFLRRSQPPP
jgi:membrane associated rhomboid family serine protease